jgi:DNA polymerase III gamma/tau subunit
MAEVLRKAEQELKWSAFPRFLVELTLLRMVRMDSSVTVEQLLAAVEGGGDGPVGGAARAAVSPHRSVSPAKKKRIEQPAVSPSLSTVEEPRAGGGGESQPASEPAPRIVSMRGEEESAESFETQGVAEGHSLDPAALWPGFIEALMGDRPNLGTFLSMGYVASATAESIDLRFGPKLKFQFSEVTRKHNRDIIESKLAAFAGRRLELHITLAREAAQTPAPTVDPGEMKARRMSPSLVDDMTDEPIIENVMKVFNGEVI